MAAQEEDLPLTQAVSDITEMPASASGTEEAVAPPAGRAEPEPEAGTAPEAEPEGEPGLDARAAAEEPEEPEEPDEPEEPAAMRGTPIDSTPRGRRERPRLPHGNALGTLIEGQFSAPGSPVRSYSDLERRSGISREALSRYVTARADRRRSPTIDTLVAIADAMHLSLDAVCRAAAASVKGVPLAPEDTRRTREEVLSPLVSGLSEDQFSAVVELLRQMRPATSS